MYPRREGRGSGIVKKKKHKPRSRSSEKSRVSRCHTLLSSAETKPLEPRPVASRTVRETVGDLSLGSADLPKEDDAMYYLEHLKSSNSMNEHSLSLKSEPVGFLNFCFDPDSSLPLHTRSEALPKHLIEEEEEEGSLEILLVSPSNSSPAGLTFPPSSPKVPKSHSPRPPRSLIPPENSPIPKYYRSPVSYVFDRLKGNSGMKEEDEGMFLSEFPQTPKSPKFSKSPSVTESLSILIGRPETEFKRSHDGLKLPTSPRIEKRESLSPPPHWENVKFEKGEYSYEAISNCLVTMTLSQLKDFFVGFELFDIDPIQLLDSLQKLLHEKEPPIEMEGFDCQKKVLLVIHVWWETLGRKYQTSCPSVSEKFESLFASKKQNFKQFLAMKNLALWRTPSFIAQVITSKMWGQFQNIRYSELLDGAWEKEDKLVRAPHVVEMTEVFNQLSSRVVESILFCDARLQALVFIIKLARYFWKLNNFEGLAAVISGLNRSPICRLKQLWGDLNSKYKRMFDFLNELLAPEMNFKLYYKTLQTVEPPVLPWMGPKLRELRFLYDGNSFLSEQGALKMSHLMTTGSSIRAILNYQKVDYSFSLCEKKNLFLEYLYGPVIPEEICYQKSLDIQPLSQKSPPKQEIDKRDAKKSSLRVNDFFTGEQDI